MKPYLGSCDVNERVPSDGREPKECDRRPASEVGEDEEGHALGHRGVSAGGDSVVAADGAVDFEVARADEHERQSVHQQQTHQIHLVAKARVVHRQTDAAKHKHNAVIFNCSVESNFSKQNS